MSLEVIRKLSILLLPIIPQSAEKSLKSDLRLGFRSRVIYETTMTCLERKLINENGELIKGKVGKDLNLQEAQNAA